MRALALTVLLAACGGSHSTPGKDGGTQPTGDGGTQPTGDGGTQPTGDGGFLPIDAGVAPSSCMAPTPPDTSTPTTTLTTCTEAALQAAIMKGGVIAFNCGKTTIAISKGLTVPGNLDTTIDGGGMITLDGGNTARILSMSGGAYRVNTHVLALVGLTLTHGKATGTMKYATAPSPCSQGYYDGYGGAVLVTDGVLFVSGCTFDSNNAEQLGPDVAGGAIDLQGCLTSTILNSTFTNNSASNGGAIGSLNSDFDVYGGTFSNNTATGNGANGDDATKCSVKATNGQNQTGSGGNGGAVSIDGGSDGAHTFCGATFTSNVGGTGALGGAIFRTPDGSKQTTTITSCTFENNQAPQGGAAYFHNSTLAVHASTFHANSAPSCAAIFSDATTFDFVNDTFADNTASSIAGTLCSFNGGDGTISYSTFSGNTTGSFAAAIFGSPVLTIEGCLFQNDVATSGPQDCQTTGSGKDDLDWPMSNAMCTSSDTYGDAQLGALGDHGGVTQTLLPSSSSPALGAGHDCPATDQRGVARPSSGCTIGAVEGST